MECCKGFLQDERFSDYGVLAPKSKADYAFLLHGLYHLKNNGTMAIVLPHGVLFRGAAEGKSEKNYYEQEIFMQLLDYQPICFTIHQFQHVLLY